MALTEKKNPEKNYENLQKVNFRRKKLFVPDLPAHHQEITWLYQWYLDDRIVGAVILVHNGLRGKGSHF